MKIILEVNLDQAQFRKGEPMALADALKFVAAGAIDQFRNPRLTLDYEIDTKIELELK